MEGKEECPLLPGTHYIAIWAIAYPLISLFSVFSQEEKPVRDLGELFPEPMWRSETMWSQGWTAVTIEVHVKVCIVYPANSHIEVSIPRISGCDHIWRQSLYRGNQVKIWSLSNMSPNPR